MASARPGSFSSSIQWRSLCPILLVLASISSAAKERVSILDFTVSTTARSSVNSDASQYLTQQVRDVATSLLDAGRFDIMTRENILVMLPPGKKDLSECEGQCEVETARNLGSRWHVVGDVKKVGTKLVLSVRLYDVVGGTQLGGVSVKDPSVDGLGDNEVATGDYAWYSGNSGNQTHPVAQKKPSAWGLYDMAGNVWEWATTPQGHSSIRKDLRPAPAV